MKKTRESAWEMNRRLLKKYGSLYVESLYNWFCASCCTFSYISSGTHLLLGCTEQQAIEVMGLSEQFLETKAHVDWDEFVLSRDWEVHRTRNHPSQRLLDIWRRVDPYRPELKLHPKK